MKNEKHSKNHSGRPLFWRGSGSTLGALLALVLIGSIPPLLAAVPVTLVHKGAVWKYLDDGSDQGAGWRAPAFDDSGWAAGPAQLGYGDGDEATLVSYGSNSSNKHITTYFRHSFIVSQAAALVSATVRLLRDDGAVVYLNGNEVWRSNMPAGTINYRTLASASVAGSAENTFYAVSLNPALLLEGVNVLAVEVHQNSASSADLSFDLELLAESEPIRASLVAPANGASGVQTAPTLAVEAWDVDGDPLNVTFYGRMAPLPPGPDFTIIVLPDTQFYVSSMHGGQPEMFVAQTEWILANRESRNVVYVAHLGDCVQNGDNNGDNAEWLHATDAMYRLEDPLRTLMVDGLPYGIAVGNHDQWPANNADGTTTFYNQYFGVEHFAGRSYYGWHYGDNNDNHYDLFSASGLDFVVIYLEYDETPDAAVLMWANDVLQTFSHRRGIVVSHSILRNDGQFSGQGQAIFNALKENPNLFLMLCGHVSAEEMRVDVHNGHTVYTLLSNFQSSRPYGGFGLLRIMEFSPANNLIRVKTYSPYFNQYETDASSDFALPYDMQGAGAFTAVSAVSNVPSGGVATVVWAGLQPETEYEWFATVSDGEGTFTTPAWRFTTVANLPPTVSVTSPPNGAAFILPLGLTMSAEASDPDGEVVRVEFFANGEKVGEAISDPFAVDWHVEEAGSYRLIAVAEDELGLATASAPVDIVVNPAPPNVPPSVSLTSPADGQTFSGPVNFSIIAAASDADGVVTKVEFFANSLKLGEDSEPPFGLSWNMVEAGSHVLVAMATDDDGAQTISTPLTVTVVPSPDPTVITRGPYLQSSSPTSIVLRWRTSIPGGTRLRYGSDPANLSETFVDGTPTTEHIVTLANLQPDTLYFYQAGTLSVWFPTSGEEFFVTPPPPGIPKPTRAWIVGNSGTGDANALAVLDGYLLFSSSRPADLWLMLGDNAYANGTDVEYQTAVFNLYPALLRNTILWPTLGDRDTAYSANPPPALPYFSIFSLPQNGESGGAPSSTERYYSFDYANIHFVCLDSVSSDRSPSGPMLAWLQNDLSATTQDWIIAFWHHPPFGRQDLDSGLGAELREMRENVLPILETHGVDVVLSGHNRGYERSFLLDGHYGPPSSFTQSMLKDGGDGREDGSGAYRKPLGRVGNQGTVYVVVGSSGATGSSAPAHPAMFAAQSALGSLVLDISGSRLDAAFVGVDGVVLDHFTILKQISPLIPPPTPTALAAVAVSDRQIRLSWSETASNEAGFEIERSLDGIDFGLVGIVGANVVNFDDGGLDAGTSYHYRVRAFNAAGASDYAAGATATTLPPGPPPPPEDVKAAASNEQVTLTWSPYSGAESYSVRRANSSGGPYEEVAGGWTSPLFIDTTVVNGSEYFYVVSAVNALGESPASSQVSATPQAPPAAPTNLTATPLSMSEIQLSWTDEAENESGFRVQSSTDGVNFFQIAQLDRDTTTCLIGGLSPLAAYVFGVTAFNNGGASGVVLTTANTLAPAAPSGLSAVPGNGCVVLSWLPSVDPAFYTVRRALASGGSYVMIATGLTTTGLTDATVTKGVGYLYVVSAVVNGAESAPSNVAFALPPGPPEAPASLQASARTANEIELSWVDLATDETGYRVLRSLQGVHYQEVAVLPPDSATCSDSGLTPDTIYFYRVLAFNPIGDSTPAELTVSTLPLPPPPPTGLVATPGNAQVILAWQPSPGAVGYVVKRAEASNGPYLPIGSALPNTSLTDTTASNHITYYYTVSAVNAGGESPPSIEVSATPLPPPAPPENLMVSVVSATGLQLSWTDMGSEETGYRVSRSADGVDFTSVVVLPANSTGFVDGGLASGTTYFYAVTAFNGSGDSLPALAFGTTLSLPAPPSQLSVTAVSPSRIDLAWTDNSIDESGFKVERRTEGGGFALIGLLPPNTPGFSDTALLASTLYTYRVRATNANGDSAASNEASATTLAPTVVVFTSVAEQDGYVSESGENSNAGGSFSSTTTGTAGLRAGDDGSNRQIKAVVSFDTSALPDDAQILSATLRLKRGTKSGTNPFTTHGVCGVDIKGGSGFGGSTALAKGDFEAAADAVAVTTLSDAPANGDWSVGALNSAGLLWIDKTGTTQFRIYFELDDNNDLDADYIGWYPGDNATEANRPQLEIVYLWSPPLPPAPAQPQHPVLSLITSNQIGFAWVDVASDETGYEVSRSLDGVNFAQVAFLGVDANGFTDAGLAPSTSYFYRVRAYNARGYSDPIELAATTLSLLPTAPLGLTATAGDARVTLVWNPAAGADSYNVGRSTSSGGPYSIVASDLTTTEFIDLAVINGTGYFYIVSARNTNGESPPSIEVSATPLPPPAPPENLMVSVVSATGLQLSWTDMASEETGYRVSRSADGVDFTSVVVLPANSTGFVDGGLASGSTYFYAVTAFNGSGDSLPALAFGTTLSLPAPPSQLSVTAVSPSRIDLAWTDNSIDESGFKVERRTEGGGFALIGLLPPNTPGFSDTALLASTLYTYRVRATNANGDSAASNEASATTLAPTVVVFTSVAEQDGYVSESGENSNAGGSFSSTTTGTAGLRAGDDGSNRQIKAVVSFDTSVLPDDAQILSATLRLKRGTKSGTNPFTTHGVCGVDIKGGSGFGGSTALAKGDFEAAADAVAVTTLSDAPANGDWSVGALNSDGLSWIDKTGTTQFRIYFELDDNNDLDADYIGWYPGDNATEANRPQLEVVYQ